MHKDQESRKDDIDLYNALIKGIESGVSNETVDSIWDQALQLNNKGN
ncbi:hypothetical protein NBT05_03535 [Aquimarina sp. ERC-38]|nr:hypothetical protein [Aquimarina sp. ERC-38]UZO81553.1 hypothetical protein NBT05_03535 [Aquimarina sp. ERC-38]